MTTLRYTIRGPGGALHVRDDTTKPFFVPQAKRHLFCGVDRHGYLPALEPCEQPTESALIDEVLETVATLRHQVSANTRQLQAQKDQLSKVFQRFSKGHQTL
ncbi:hypothetical protein LCGC14_0894420 [marine sediment metagenome]|uniref:Uncharacterized protein n=1 Tax=marine sediment metagenome TaxID=412755 RepID=A0A0F9PJ18_9ZZZZ